MTEVVGGGEARGSVSDSATADLSRLVGEAPRPAARSSADLSRLVGTAPRPAARSSADLTALVGDAAPRRDDRGWMAPELAQAGRRPRFSGRARGGSVGILNIVVAVAAIALLAGTTTVAVVQRATADPAAEAMDGLREREAELQNDIKGLQTSADLLDAVVQEAMSSSQSAAGVLPTLRGRVDGPALDAAEAARASLDSRVAAVPTVLVPGYERGVVDEASVEQIGYAADRVRRAGEELPPLVSQVRTARADVTAALEGFRGALRDLGASIQTTASGLVESQDAAGESFRTAVATTAASVVAAQQSGGDGLTEMAAFASAVDALTAENTRVLEEAQRQTPVRTPSVRSPSPTTPADPGGSGGGEPSPQPTQDPGTGGGQEPTPAPSPSETDATGLPIDPLIP